MRDCSPVADVKTSAVALSVNPPDKTSAFSLAQKTLTLKHLEHLCYQVYVKEYVPKSKAHVSSSKCKVIIK